MSGSSTVRKTVVAGVLGAVSIVLIVTPLGMIPWVTGTSLTTMHVPDYRMSLDATQMLIRMILRPSVKPEPIVIPVELVIRNSCGVRSEKRRSTAPRKTEPQAANGRPPA